MRDLVVYGTHLHGRRRAIIAARTKKEAAEAFRYTANEFRDFACRTGNDVEVALAMGEPGALFVADNNGPLAPIDYKRVSVASA